MKVAKEFESQMRKVKSGIEKDKTTLQRQHSKTLKKAEKQGCVILQLLIKSNNQHVTLKHYFLIGSLI